MFTTIVVALVVGAVIGVIARMVLPGKQNISGFATVGLGAVGALAGSWVVSLLTDREGFNVLALVVGVAVAAVLIGVFEKRPVRR